MTCLTSTPLLGQVESQKGQQFLSKEWEEEERALILGLTTSAIVVFFVSLLLRLQQKQQIMHKS